MGRNLASTLTRTALTRTALTRTALTLLLGSSLALAPLATRLDTAEAQAAGLQVTEITTARGYASGTGAVDATDSFRRSDGRVFVVLRVENPSRTESDLHVAFEQANGTPQSGTPAGVTLHVPAQPRYRTVARTSTNRAPGRWRAVVRDDAGAVLSTVEFTVTE